MAYTQLTHTVLSPGAPDRWRIFRINMWALAISHTLPGGQVPGTAASYKLLTDADVSGSTAAFGLATQGIGSAVVLNVIFWLALLISIPLQGYNPLYGFAAILGVLLLAIFAGVVFLLTRGEKQAGVFLKKVADRLPFVRAETVTSLVQKVADRMKILFTSSELLVQGGQLGGGQLAARLPLAVRLPPRLRRPRRRRSTSWSPTGWPTSWPSSRSRRAGWA